ncbi:pilus (MSHA type) biogenesis protein MshL [Aurantivibrio plasticivorans]
MQMKISHRWLVRSQLVTTGLFLSTLLTACASQQDEQPTIAETFMENSIEEARSQPPIDTEQVSQRLLQDALGEKTPKSDLEVTFDVSVRNLPAQTFFKGLVEGTVTNLVVHPEVRGSVTLDLKQVTVAEVLDVARDIFGYEFTLRNGIYTVYPRTLRTEVFAIDYIDVKRQGSSNTSVLVGQVRSNDDNNNNSNGGSGRNSSDAEVASGARIKTQSDADFWAHLKLSLEAIVGIDLTAKPQLNQPMVMVNPQTGMAVVRALPAELTAVRKFLEQSQLSAARQVILETKIVEVKLNDGFEAGIDWSTIQGQVGYGYNQSRSSLGTPTEVIDQAFQAVFAVPNITDFISFLDTQGSVQILSSPRVSTVNNQKALIRVGSDEFFVTGISNSTTTGAATTTSTPDIELTSFFSGIALDVTPQIADDGDVILHIHPVISDVTDQLKELTVGDEEFSLPLAYRDIRESDSIVKAKNGQVIVLGGLMQEVSREQMDVKPWFGKVPGLNVFFRRDDDQNRKTELVILMRPIVVDDDAWERDITRSNNRIKDMGNGYREKF